jgi:hypothetical protein
MSAVAIALRMSAPGVLMGFVAHRDDATNVLIRTGNREVTQKFAPRMRDPNGTSLASALVVD